MVFFAAASRAESGMAPDFKESRYRHVVKAQQPARSPGTSTIYPRLLGALR